MSLRPSSTARHVIERLTQARAFLGLVVLAIALGSALALVAAPPAFFATPEASTSQ